MKTSGARRALILADVFNLLVALYLIAISIVSLVKLRWYHQLTVAVKTRHVITSATSYFAFFILLIAAIVLIAIFVLSTVKFSPKTYISPSSQQQQQPDEPTTGDRQTAVKHLLNEGRRFSPNRLVIRDSTASGSSYSSNSADCCTILLHLVASVALVVVLVLWLLNTGELVRDSISTQLDSAFAKYQFQNRSNHYSVAIDGMQDTNNCCGSLDYTDFPHQRISGLSMGNYPGSCCGKNIFGVNARVICTPEEISRAHQTVGCVTVLSNYYDLISLLVVPVALVSLFVNVTIIGLIVISKGHGASLEFNQKTNRDTPMSKFELKASS